MTPEFAAFLGQFGLPITILVVAAVFGARGTWRWGREVEAAERREAAAEKRAQEWQDIALQALQVGERVVKAVVAPDE